MGYFIANIKIADHIFKDIRIYVMDSEIPIILGNNLLKHDSIKSLTYDRELSIIRFEIRGGLITETKLANRHQIYNEITTLMSDIPRNMKIDYLTEIKNVHLDTDLPHDEREDIINILYKYRAVLGSDDDQMGVYKARKCRIPTNGKSIAINTNHIPQALEKDVSLEIQKMLKTGVIEPCGDPRGFNSPIFAVKKKSGSVRVVANFKGTVNKVLVEKDPYPTPDMDRLINKIGHGNSYFGVCDFRSGFWQIDIDERDRYVTAFTWNGRTYQYARLAMGLTTAGSIFGRCVSEAMETIPADLRQNISTYLDDNLLFAKDFITYKRILVALLDVLYRTGLRLGPAKCSFLAKKATFLGRLISYDGVRPDPQYVQGILDMSPPKNHKELQQTIGRLTWIRQFCETQLFEPIRANSFSHILKPISILNRKDTPFIWSSEAQKAFNRIKSKLSRSPIISFADFDLPFIVTTDASEYAAGATLTQVHSNGKLSLVAAVSKTFTQTEQRYSPTEREALALKWAIVDKLSYFLAYRPFTLFTDHKALTFLDRTMFNNSKIQRWQSLLTPFRFVVQYIPGSKNQFADFLSRPLGLNSLDMKQQSLDKPAGTFFKVPDSDVTIYCPSWMTIDKADFKLIPVCSPPKMYLGLTNLVNYNSKPKLNISAALTLEKIRQDQDNDDIIGPIKAFLERRPDKSEITDILSKDDHRTKIFISNQKNLFLQKGTDLLILKKSPIELIVVPTSLQRVFLDLSHDKLNHCGINRTRSALDRFWWPLKDHDIRAYIDSCTLCAKAKGNWGRVPNWTTGHVKRGTFPFECIYLDFVTMPLSKGKKYILTMIDSYSRYFIAIPFRHERAIDAAQGLYKLYLQHRIIPKYVSSDRGTHFTGSVFIEFNKIFGSKQLLHCAYRPESSGILERQHRTMKSAIFILSEERGVPWPDLLEEIVSNMNSMKNSATNVAPHFVLTGREPEIGLPKNEVSLTRTPDPKSYAQALVRKLQAVKKAVILAAKAADIKLEERVNKPKNSPLLSPGEKVLLHRPQSRQAKDTHMNWIEGYEVVTSNNCVVKVRNISTSHTDWVHRHQIRVLPPRPEHLIEDITDPIPSTRGQYDTKVDKIGYIKPIRSINPIKTLEQVKPDSESQIADETMDPDSDDFFEAPEAETTMERTIEPLPQEESKNDQIENTDSNMTPSGDMEHDVSLPTKPKSKRTDTLDDIFNIPDHPSPLLGRKGRKRRDSVKLDTPPPRKAADVMDDAIQSALQATKEDNLGRGKREKTQRTFYQAGSSK